MRRSIAAFILTALLASASTHAPAQTPPGGQAGEQVYVIGRVVTPRVITLHGPLTISQAIAMTGGVLPPDAPGYVYLIRQDSKEKRSDTIISLKAIKKHRTEDLTLQPNDILEVMRKAKPRGWATIVPPLSPQPTLPVRIIP